MPVIADILRRYPEAQIDWLVEESFIELVQLVHGVRRAIPFSLRRWRKRLFSPDNWREIGAFRRALAAEKYDLVIDCQGRIWKGRDLEWKGAHAGNKDANENNVGVALIGNFENCEPSKAQVTAAEDLLVWLSLEYGVPSSKIYTHNEIERMYGIKGTTCCPGRRFGPTLTRLKKAVDAAQARGSVAAAQ